MRKKLSFVLMAIIIFTMLPCRGLFAETSNSWQGSETRNIYIGEGVNFEGEFNVGNETKTVLPDGTEQYTKRANIIGDFIKNPNNEIILNEVLDVTFKYNKVDAWIENPKTDIIINNHYVDAPKWRVTNNEEVYVSPGQCIASGQSALSKKASWFNIRKSWNNVGNFHADIVCTANGEIKFNTESLEMPTENEFTLKNSSSEEKILQDNITEKTTITDETYSLNNQNQNDQVKDMYNYVTRRIESNYFDPEKNQIAATIMRINFRYNTQTKEVECISTSHKENIANNQINMDVYVRTGDKTRNHAGAYGTLNLDYYNKRGEKGNIEEALVASCDYNGNITSQITTK